MAEAASLRLAPSPALSGSAPNCGRANIIAATPSIILHFIPQTPERKTALVVFRQATFSTVSGRKLRKATCAVITQEFKKHQKA